MWSFFAFMTCINHPRIGKGTHMNSIKDIQHMVLNAKAGLPDTVYVREKGDLLLLNYKPSVQYSNIWTYFDVVSICIDQKTLVPFAT